MSILDLREAQAKFENNLTQVVEARKPLHQIRANFVKYFTPTRIQSMEYEDYALGYAKKPGLFNFCYDIERTLDGLGRILGADAKKFGMYYSSGQKKLLITKKWSTNIKDPLGKIKQSIVNLIEAGKQNDLRGIADNPISLMFKGKILSTYYPDRYLNVFADEHLNYFLRQFNLDNHELISGDAAYKKEVLVEFKNGDAVMKKWPLDLFQYFLYNHYPSRPPQKSQMQDPLAEYRLIDFPSDPSPSLVELELLAHDPDLLPPRRGVKIGGSPNPDYEAEARKQKQLGNRGEKIVLDFERTRLINAGKTKLAGMVDKTKFDYEGFDILSFEEDGSARYIEVKATRAKPGTASFFLSANELEKAMNLPNYYIYIVFEILDPDPQVCIMVNPFNPDNDHFLKKPVSYKIHFNAKRK